MAQHAADRRPVLLFLCRPGTTSGVKASIIEAVNVFVAILVASLIFHQEKLTASKMIGCAIGFVGVVLINMSGMNFQMTVMGEGFIFLSTIAYAFSSVYLKRFSLNDHPVMLSGHQFVIGGIIMAIIGTCMGGTITTITWKGIMLLIYLALISAVAYSIWGLLLKYNPISRVTVKKQEFVKYKFFAAALYMTIILT